MRSLLIIVAAVAFLSLVVFIASGVLPGNTWPVFIVGLIWLSVFAAIAYERSR